MSRTTVLILLDAFRWDYINKENTPFLWKLAQENIYVKKLKPCFSFCERTEIFTGACPEKTGNFTVIGYNPEKSPFSCVSKLLKASGKVLNNPVCDNKYTRKLAVLLLRLLKINFPISKIPYYLLPFFSLTEDLHDFDDERSFGGDSILGRMKERGKTWFYDSFTALGMFNGGDDDRIEKAIEATKLRKDLYLLFIGKADFIGHYYGGTSLECCDMRQRVDQKIKKVVESFEGEFEDLNLVILGDHGMVDVKDYFNALDKINKIAKENGFVSGRDFLVFADSTMIRFWFFNDAAKNSFSVMLDQQEFKSRGKVITEEIAKDYQVPIPSSLYGQMVWWANLGVVVYPDYFHRAKKVKGMHGYDPTIDESKGFCIVKMDNLYPRFVEEGQLIDVCPTLADLLDVFPPKGNQGKSFIRK